MSRKLSLSSVTGHIQPFVFLFLPFMCTVWSATADNSSRFVQAPEGPFIVTLGQNALLTWRYRLSHYDRRHLDKIEFGIWNHGIMRTRLITVTKTNITVANDNNLDSIRARWLGNWKSRSAVFELLDVTSKYSSRYGCSLSFRWTRPNITETVELFVRDPPRIVQKSPKTIARKGERVVLLCDVEGDPKPLVTWYRGSHILQNSTSKTSFIISQAATNVSGTYKCFVSNEVGSRSYKVEVSVTLDSIQSNEGSLPKEYDVPVRSYPQGTHHFVISSLCIGLVFLILLAAYSVFTVKSKRTRKLVQKRKLVRDPNDEQTTSLISDWSNYEDNGQKL